MSKEPRFLKYINGIKYTLLDDMRGNNPESMLTQEKVNTVCEKYLIPENKPLATKAKGIMLIQNDTCYEDFGRYIPLDDFISRILFQITNDGATQTMLNTQFKKMLNDTLLDASSEYRAKTDDIHYDILPMQNGYFSKESGRFIKDQKPEISMGFADIRYEQQKPDEPVYAILKSLLEKNPDYAENLFVALADAANKNTIPTEQFYAAVCDSQPYAPCKGCTADKSTACARCSRNRYISDMYTK